ncbi:hypothetical protein C8039_07235 [Halogeometricum sp. wsp3]|nr:hypothetical protein C8039_07235 [Halogeometricum sp. wsp3]
MPLGTERQDDALEQQRDGGEVAETPARLRTVSVCSTPGSASLTRPPATLLRRQHRARSRSRHRTDSRRPLCETAPALPHTPTRHPDGPTHGNQRIPITSPSVNPSASGWAALERTLIPSTGRENFTRSPRSRRGGRTCLTAPKAMMMRSSPPERVGRERSR